MRTYIILLSCLCGTLGITIHYGTTEGLLKNTKDYKNSLKDIRLVPTTQGQSRQKTIKERNKPTEEAEALEKSTTVELPINQPKHAKSREDKQKFRASQNNKLAAMTQNRQNFQGSGSHQNYMHKMANQLYLAQKHASLLSDYQKFILNQDPNIKSYVFSQGSQARNPKSLSRTKENGKAITVETANVKYLGLGSVKETNTSSKKVDASAKVTNLEKVSLQQNDHLYQPTNIKYVAVSPQPLTYYVNDHKEVVLPQYQIAQPHNHYVLAETPKSQIEIPSALPVSFGSSESLKYHYQDDNHQIVHTEPKYEFMYKVKAQEKNNHFGHMESRKGDATYGYYYVHLPDGRLETVKYWADKTGYHAKVDYHGEAKHPPTLDYKVHSHPQFVHH